jgi:hypothetical protein
MYYNKHYISVDNRSRIVNGFSDAFREPSDTDICINEQGGYQFRLFPGGEENPALFADPYMIPMYKYEGNKVAKRTEEEIAADVPEPAPESDAISDSEALRIITGEVDIDEAE